MTPVELSIAKDKAGKSPQRRRKPGKPDSVVFSDNWSMIDKYAEHGTSVALSGKPDSFFSRKEFQEKKLMGKLTQQKEARYEQ